MSIRKYLASTALTLSLLAAPACAATIQNPQNIQQVSAVSTAARAGRCLFSTPCRKAMAKALQEATEKFGGLILDIGGQIGEIYQASIAAMESGDRKELAKVKKQLETALADLADQSARNRELEARNRVLRVQLNQIYRILTALENDMDVGV